MQAPSILGDRYELRRVLGRGGMAEVRDGWDTRLQRAVAIKLLHPVFSTDPQNRRRFDLEARAAAGLSHPNVVAVHDSGENDGTPYIVMERLPGPTLADAIAHGPVPPDRVRAILDQLLSALGAAHGAGILHRDIKPGNILFTDTGDAKVVDFGIAKSPGGAMTEAGQVFGTMAYLSAERIAGRPATVADDLYAVGVVGYEALTGRRPFPQDNMADLVRAISAAAPPSLAMLRPDADPRLLAVIDRAMARDQRWRFGSAREMRAALWQPLAAPMRPVTQVLSAGGVAAPAVRHRTRAGALLALAAAALAGLSGVILLAMDSGSSQSPPAQRVGTSTVAPPPPPFSVRPTPTFSAPLIEAEQIKPGSSQARELR